MKTRIIAKNTANYEREKLNLSWENNSSVQRLLDVIAYIIANEYVGTIKENPTLFSDTGGSK